MRPLGAITEGATRTEISITYKAQATMSNLLQIWNDWEIQLMVLTSFMLQLFLLLTGNLRRRNISRLLRGLIWLAYVGADSVAVYALGLFSQYEDKYKLGRHSYIDTLPILWVPFFLVHLGGQDSITAFSMEDNNLWLRHLLNLGIQVALALYVLWKSFHKIDSLVLMSSTFIFVSGIIKYGERTWALKGGSRDGLSTKIKRPNASTRQENNRNGIYSYALQTVLLVRGLFVGRTVLQLGDGVQQILRDEFVRTHEEKEAKLNTIVMELGMMFDLLYSKALVLLRLWGRIFRCVSQISMLVAFMLFIWSEKRDHNRVNVVISYTLFLGAIFMECCSVLIVIASPWTRAVLKESGFLYWVSSGSDWFLSKAIQRNKKQWLSNSMGQFNLMDCSISEKSIPTLILTIVGALGLEQQWRNLLRTKHIEAMGIAEDIVKWFDRPREEWFGQLQLGRELNFTLSIPFEHALYRLHIYTDLHISRHFSGTTASHADDVMLLKEDCEKLSNYMMYLIATYPSMLPVSTSTEDFRPDLPKWVRNCSETTKLMTLEKYVKEELRIEMGRESAWHPFVHAQDGSNLRRSLEEIKEMWVRLLIYSAGKCSGEIHALQLGKGGELLTFVWLLMVHHGIGDVATELNLLTSDDPGVPQLGSVVVAEGSNFIQRPEQPRYAFDFRYV